MLPNARASVVGSSRQRSANSVAQCALTGARKGLFAKSPCRREIAIELGLAALTVATSAYGPGCVKSRIDAMILRVNRRIGSAGCQASWRGLIGAKAVCFQRHLRTM